MLPYLQKMLAVRWAWGEVETYEDALGDAYLKLGRLDDAIREYERALAVFPGMALARFHLAQAYQRQGRKLEAIAQFKQFRELWKYADADLPEVADARRALAATGEDLDRRASAINAAHK